MTFRFTLGGLFGCLFCIAFGLAESRRGDSSFSSGLAAALSACAAIGFACQARDLWRYSHGRDEFTREQRRSVRFAIGWRISAILTWIGYYVLREGQAAELFSLPEETDWGVFFDVGRALRTALLDLLLLIAAGASFRTLSRRSSRVRQVVAGLAIVAGLLLSLLLYWDEMAITFLIHAACERIDAACFWPYRFASVSAVPTLAERYQPFVGWSAAAAALATINVVMLWRLAVYWPIFRWRRTVVFALGFSLLGAVEYRLTTTLFTKASPYMAASTRLAPAYYYFFATALTGLALATSTYRICARPWSDQDDVNVAWRASRGYPHERLLWMVFLAVAMIAEIIEDPIHRYNGWSWPQTVRILVAEIIYEPKNIVSLALFILASGRLLAASCRRRRVVPGVAAVDLVQYAVVWCLAFMLAPLVVVASASLSFAVWLTPWVF